jgi:hypothetical protein
MMAVMPVMGKGRCDGGHGDGGYQGQDREGLKGLHFLISFTAARGCIDDFCPVGRSGKEIGSKNMRGGDGKIPVGRKALYYLETMR